MCVCCTLYSSADHPDGRICHQYVNIYTLVEVADEITSSILQLITSHHRAEAAKYLETSVDIIIASGTVKQCYI